MDVKIITPEPGRHREIGQLLFALADDPKDITWVTYPHSGFQVPESLFQAFETAVDAILQAAGATSFSDVIAPSAPKTFTDGDTDLVALKKRGRPKKQAPAKAEEGEK